MLGEKRAPQLKKRLRWIIECEQNHLAVLRREGNGRSAGLKTADKGLRGVVGARVVEQASELEDVLVPQRDPATIIAPVFPPERAKNTAGGSPSSEWLRRLCIPV